MAQRPLTWRGQHDLPDKGVKLPPLHPSDELLGRAHFRLVRRLNQGENGVRQVCVRLHVLHAVAHTATSAASARERQEVVSQNERLDQHCLRGLANSVLVRPLV